MGDKIFLRYIRVYIEITNDGSNVPDFPFVRCGVLTPRGEAIASADFNEDDGITPFDTNLYTISEDFALPISNDRLGASEAIPGMIRLSKTLKVFKSI